MMPLPLHKARSRQKHFSLCDVEGLDCVQPLQHLWDEVKQQLWAWPNHSLVLDHTNGLMPERHQVSSESGGPDISG